MSRIVWLASYPKSGNTWLRALLTNYLADGDAPASINELSGGPMAAARVQFDEWAGVEASSLDQATIDRLRPEVYRRLAGSAPAGPAGAGGTADTIFMKVHDAWTRVDTGEPMFPPDATKGVVYIVRNPLDVAPSAAHHFGETVEEAVDRMCGTRRRADVDEGALPDQLRQRMGSWSDHVRSWVDESGLAVHVVRYEDLSADPTAAFAAIVRFAELDHNEARIDKAVRFSGFAELQRQERASGFRERLTCAQGSFFRRGEVGSWKTDLAEGLAVRLSEECGPVMDRLGYQPVIDMQSRDRVVRGSSVGADPVHREADHEPARQDADGQTVRLGGVG